MPGKGQLFRDSKDANFLPFLSFSAGIARQDESCLRKIHLTRESLHFPIIQSARVGENGERITRQRRLREDVELNEFISTVRHKTLSDSNGEHGQSDRVLVTRHVSLLQGTAWPSVGSRWDW